MCNAFPCREVLVMVMRKHQRYFPLYKHQSGGWGGVGWGFAVLVARWGIWLLTLPLPVAPSTMHACLLRHCMRLCLP